MKTISSTEAVRTNSSTSAGPDNASVSGNAAWA
jgi:hypothetical protein